MSFAYFGVHDGALVGDQICAQKPAGSKNIGIRIGGDGLLITGKCGALFAPDGDVFGQAARERTGKIQLYIQQRSGRVEIGISARPVLAAPD